MWQEKYQNNNNGGFYRNLSREDDGTLNDEISRYEIIFEWNEQRYYCFINAINMDEALGIFFKNHNTVEYNRIIDHVEI